jgi:hypothetical protein
MRELDTRPERTKMIAAFFERRATEFDISPTEQTQTR